MWQERLEGRLVGSILASVGVVVMSVHPLQMARIGVLDGERVVQIDQQSTAFTASLQPFQGRLRRGSYWRVRAQFMACTILTVASSLTWY